MVDKDPSKIIRVNGYAIMITSWVLIIMFFNIIYNFFYNKDITEILKPFLCISFFLTILIRKNKSLKKNSIEE